MSTWAMDHICSIERNTPVSDGGGGFTDAWAALVTNTKCRGWFEGSRVMAIGDKPAVVESRSVIVPLGTGVREGDRVLNVRNSAGTVIFAGPFQINSVAHRQDHDQLYSLETN